MGLDIGDYSASYGQLHRLRQFALDVEKNKIKQLKCVGMENCGKCFYCMSGDDFEKVGKTTRFPEFIQHSDCDGGYISVKKMGLKVSNKNKFRKDLYWGDLDKLKMEVKELNKHKKRLKGWDLKSWECFHEDVVNAVWILRFH